MAIASALPDQRSFGHHVLDFLAYLEYERGLSRNTLEAYRSDLLQLGDYLERAGVDVLAAQDVDLRHGILRARGKGSKERLVPVGREAVTAVRSYLQRSRPELVGLREERRLFVNRRGSGLTRQGLYKIVQRHARAVGL